MPIVPLILVVIAIVGSTLFLTYQVKVTLRRRRNLRHYERDEPLENVGDWD